MAITRSAPCNLANFCAISQIGPQPSTITVSPNLTSACSTLQYAVGTTSDKNNTCSSFNSLSGTLKDEKSANGTLKYSAWLPSGFHA